MTNELKVGDYAVSIETGWLGKILGFDEMNGDKMARMVGVNWACVVIAGKDREESLDTDDTRWYSPEDLVADKSSAPAFSL